jgi:hypothetical protein
VNTRTNTLGTEKRQEDTRTKRRVSQACIEFHFFSILKRKYIKSKKISVREFKRREIERRELIDHKEIG